MDHGLEALVGFVGAHGDAFEFLEFTEEVLDQMFRNSCAFSMPATLEISPFVRTCDSASEIVTRSNWPKRISQAFLTPSHPTTIVVLRVP